MIKNLPASAGDSRNVGLIPGWGRSQEEETATCSSSLALKIPWTEEPGLLQSMGSQELDSRLSNYTITTNMYKVVTLTGGIQFCIILALDGIMVLISNLKLSRLESYDQPRHHIQKQRHYFANKGPSSQGYGFSCGHVWM